MSGRGGVSTGEVGVSTYLITREISSFSPDTIGRPHCWRRFLARSLGHPG